MTWVKLSDTFAEEIEELGAEAGMLHVAGLCYCARLLTNGAIPRRKAARLFDMDEPEEAVKSLVKAGLWEETADGYQIVDYLTDQPSADQVNRDRALKNERQQRWREAKRGRVDGRVDASTPSTETRLHRLHVDGAPPRPAPKEGVGTGVGVAASPDGSTAHPSPEAVQKPTISISDLEIKLMIQPTAEAIQESTPEELDELLDGCYVAAFIDAQDESILRDQHDRAEILASEIMARAVQLASLDGVELEANGTELTAPFEGEHSEWVTWSAHWAEVLNGYANQAKKELEGEHRDV